MSGQKPSTHLSINESTDIFQLVYVSEACPDLCYTDLENILFSARKRNSDLNVTGMLIYRDGFFIQFLEGTQKNVKDVIGRIIQDRRHSKLRVVGEWYSLKRYFEKWSMSFVDGDLLEDIHPFLQQILSDVMLVTLPDQNQFAKFYEDFIKEQTIL